MIRINKEEKDAIRARYPDVCIIRTMKQDSGRHHYYLEEAPRVVRYLNRLRGIDDGTRYPVKRNRTGGGHHGR